MSNAIKTAEEYYHLAVNKIDLIFDQNNTDKRNEIYQETINYCDLALASSPNHEIEIRSHGLKGIVYSHLLSFNNEDQLIKDNGISSIPNVNNSIIEKETAIMLDIKYGLKIYANPKDHFDFFPMLESLFSQETIFITKHKDADELWEFLKSKLLLILDTYGFCYPTLALYVGELYRRDNNFKEAEYWFNKCLQSVQLFLDIPHFYGKNDYTRLKVNATALYQEVKSKLYDPNKDEFLLKEKEKLIVELRNKLHSLSIFFWVLIVLTVFFTIFNGPVWLSILGILILGIFYYDTNKKLKSFNKTYS